MPFAGEIMAFRPLWAHAVDGIEVAGFGQPGEARLVEALRAKGALSGGPWRLAYPRAFSALE